MKKKYIRVADRRVGLDVKNRPVRPTKNANQWVSDPRHDLFAYYWLTPIIDGKKNELFGNAYQSAVKAGFSTNHATQITSNVLSLEWVKAAKSKLSRYSPDHIVKKLEKLTDSDKDSDAIRALEVLARIQGLFIDRSIVHQDVVFRNEVPRPITEVDVTPSAPNKE